MKTSQTGIDFIKGWEKFEPNLYNDAAGNATIGYGRLVHMGAVDGSECDEFKAGITEARACELMAEDLQPEEDAVNTGVEIAIAQPQFDALVSFSYNVGRGAFMGSTLLKLLNAGDVVQWSDPDPDTGEKFVIGGAAHEFLRWDIAGGRHVQGLENRRRAEMDLFLQGVAA